MSTVKLCSFALLTSLVASACGDDPEEARDKCEALVTTYCDHVVSCATAGDLLDEGYTANDLRGECERALELNARCDDVVRVSKSFNQCIDDASTLSCTSLNASLLDQDLPMPDSCQGAVIYLD